MNQSIYQQAVAELVRQADEAQQRGDACARTASLATATLDGRPSLRTVNIVRISDAGLCFFAEAASGKAQQLLANPRAACCFHWALTHCQAAIEGNVTTLSVSESDELWRRQPRDYGLSHWASSQAGEAVPTAERKERLKAVREEFKDQRVPLPSGWSGYQLEPDRIDLWAASWQRLELHRTYIKSVGGTWSFSQRNP